MKPQFSISSYGYWIDNHANIHAVTQSEEHTGALARLGFVGDNLAAMSAGWIRVAPVWWDKKCYCEFSRRLSPAKKEAIWWLCTEHGLVPYDERTNQILEARRMSVEERHHQAIAAICS